MPLYGVILHNMNLIETILWIINHRLACERILRLANPYVDIRSYMAQYEPYIGTLNYAAQ